MSQHLPRSPHSLTLPTNTLTKKLEVSPNLIIPDNTTERMPRKHQNQMTKVAAVSQSVCLT
jgi:hypothetical protein